MGAIARGQSTTIAPVVPVDRNDSKFGFEERSAPARRARGERLARSAGAHPVVLGVVGELGQPERLEQRRHVDAEPPTQALLQPIPPADRVGLRASPRLDRPVGRGLLLVRATERHPVAVRLEHGVQVVDRPPVVLELRPADLADDRRRIAGVVEVHRVLGRPRRCLEDPRIRLGAAARLTRHGRLLARR